MVVSCHYRRVRSTEVIEHTTATCTVDPRSMFIRLSTSRCRVTPHNLFDLLVIGLPIFLEQSVGITLRR